MAIGVDNLIKLAVTCSTATFFIMANVAVAQDTAERAVVYKIRSGDTLSGLSYAIIPGHKVRQEIERLNGISNPNLIVAGNNLGIPERLLREEMITARIEALSGPVTIGAGTHAIAAATGTALTEGGLIDTGQNAFVTLRLPDGSAVSIPSQSRIRILRLRKIILSGAVEREFGIDAGHIRAKVTPMTNPGSDFHIITPVTVSAVRGTEFRVDYDASSGLAATQVETGKVAMHLSGPKTDLLVSHGFGAAASAHSNTGITPLIAAPEMIDPARVQFEDKLSFSVKPLAAAGSYRIQIARDAGLLDVVAEKYSALPELELPSLADGTYFARVSAIDGSGIEGLPRIFAFDRFRNAVKGTMTSTGVGRQRRYLFEWASDSDADPWYRFQLTGSKTGAVPIVDEPGLRQKNLTVSNLPADDYTWHVTSSVAVAGRILENTGPEQNFSVLANK